MRIQEKQKALEQEVIANLCAIPKMPENMLPHTVYVEEEGEDGYGHGIPVYTMYRLEEIRTDGSCTLYNAESRERFTCRHLHEINMDWLVTVWERYLELCVEQDIWKGNAVASSAASDVYKRQVIWNSVSSRISGKGMPLHS